MIDARNGAVEIAASVKAGRRKAVDVARDALALIGEADRTLNCFTAVTAERALLDAALVDETVARGEEAGPLAGVPLAVKNLFDVRGLPTVAGSIIDRDRRPATNDATLVARLVQAGAVIVGVTNMDEYAMGYTTENSHYGPTRNPHDERHIAGGSSGGSAAAVAAGFAPLALGSDTGGSIGVPASLCGVYGLKPTYGRMSRRGTQLLAWSFDHFGPLARSVHDLAVAYDAMQGDDAADASSVAPPVESVLSEVDKGIDDLRIGIWRGDEDTLASSEALEGVCKLAAVLGAQHEVALPEAARARAAASIMTGCEGSSLHASALRERTDEFDPLVRDRLLAASLIPSAWYVHANRLRHWFRERVLELFRGVDLILMPATPFSAPRIGETTQRIGQHEVQVRRHLGAFAQPASFLGFPVLTVPVRQSALRLPIGVSIIAPPWREVLAFRAAAVAEASGA